MRFGEVLSRDDLEKEINFVEGEIMEAEDNGDYHLVMELRREKVYLVKTLYSKINEDRKINSTTV
jgi:hypothetical protein